MCMGVGPFTGTRTAYERQEDYTNESVTQKSSAKEPEVRDISISCANAQHRHTSNSGELQQVEEVKFPLDCTKGSEAGLQIV